MLSPSQLVGLDDSHLIQCNVGQKAFMLHPQVSRDLLALKAAAEQAGMNLCIASGFRSFERQQLIWNSKMSGERVSLDIHGQPVDLATLSERNKIATVLLWSALPGTSRHHWGSDFDLYDANATSAERPLQLTQQEYLSGDQQAFFGWLRTAAPRFGFFFPFDGVHSGYQFEPWHISHLATWHKIKAQLTPQSLYQTISQQSVLGFESIANEFNRIYTDYVLAVNEGDLDGIFD
ncbi:M15 family metallopeptidase [Vibrio sp. WXL210]|uniref:M15 family metallopeptidase n=1 Tax=Vibrio sp. WXL210 TaxID=3450709 RepID=UPI003EC72B77